MNEIIDKIKTWKNNENHDSFPRTTKLAQPIHEEVEIKQKIRENLERILLNFERASTFHFKGDSYLFYKFFNQCMNDAINIHAYIKDPERDWINPSRILKGSNNQYEKSFITNIFPVVSGENYNENKRSFIDWLEGLLEEIEDNLGEEVLPMNDGSIIEFLEHVYLRDFLYNTRKVNGTSNIFRSPNPARFREGLMHLQEYYMKNNITDIIDLRGEEESQRNRLSKKEQERLKVKIHVFDFNEPKVTKEPAPGYVKKLIYRSEAVKESFKVVDEASGGVLIHCASGKDRTGVLAAVFQKILGMSDEEIIEEYTLPGLDCRPDRITDVLNFLKKEGGIHQYLKNHEFSEDLISRVEEKIKQ